MKIRTKLTSLVSVTLAGALSVAVVIILFLVPIARILEERSVFIELKDAQFELGVAILRLPDESFGTGFQWVEESLEKSEAGFGAVESLVHLPSLSEDIRKSIEIILRLQDIKAEREQLIVDLSQEVAGKADEVFHSANFRMRDLPSSPLAANAGYAEYFETAMETYRQDSINLIYALDGTIGTIDEQFAIIEGEIRKIIIRGLAVSAGIGLMVISLSLAFSVLLARRIGNDVRFLHMVMNSLEQGDLTPKDVTAGRDEIGDLSRSLARFSANLADSVRRIQVAAEKNRKAGEELSGASEQASSTSEEMRSNTASIEGQMRILDGNVEESAAAVGEIAGNIEDADRELGMQAELVERSARALEQMLDSLAAVSGLILESDAAADDLEKASRRGGERLEETASTISSIRGGVDGVRDITGMIQSIASRTNLLAMNAAIEAAHAGDAGRGFAVVADEIRKLAEAASRNSKEISDILNGMIDSIEEADKAGKETHSAFGTLDERVRYVKKAVGDIRSSIADLERNGSEIRGTMDELNAASLRVAEGSRTMRGRSGQVHESTESLRRVSREVNGGVGEITLGLGEVAETMGHLLDVSRNIGSVGEELDRAVAVFRVEDVPAESEAFPEEESIIEVSVIGDDGEADRQEVS